MNWASEVILRALFPQDNLTPSSLPPWHTPGEGPRTGQRGGAGSRSSDGIRPLAVHPRTTPATRVLLHLLTTNPFSACGGRGADGQSTAAADFPYFLAQQVKTQSVFERFKSTTCFRILRNCRNWENLRIIEITKKDTSHRAQKQKYLD